MSLRIGPFTIEPSVLLAPMAGVSEMPFRVLAQEMGAGLCTTELISAKGIFYKNRRTQQYLTYDKEKERPYSVQLFGGEIEPMCAAAQEAVRIGADIIDINMGCPVKKVTKTGSGCALLTEPARAADLVKAMREAVDDQVPITAKIRTGWDEHSITCLDMAKHLEDAGCAALAVHGRTRAQMYKGKANWDHIARMVEAVDMPIIGNGDITSYEEAMARLSETGCDAVMIGRGALGNPWVFESCKAGRSLPAPGPEHRYNTIVRHFAAHVAFHQQLDEERDPDLQKRMRYSAEEQAVRTFRQHLIWYSRGLRGGSQFRKRAVLLETPAEVGDALARFFESMTDDAFDPTEEAEGVNYKQAFG